MAAPDGAAAVSPGRLIGVTADRARRYLRHQVIGEDHAQRERQSVGDLVRRGRAQVRRIGHGRAGLSSGDAVTFPRRPILGGASRNGGWADGWI
jgi:hypothetical protein